MEGRITITQGARSYEIIALTETLQFSCLDKYKKTERAHLQEKTKSVMNWLKTICSDRQGSL